MYNEDSPREPAFEAAYRLVASPIAILRIASDRSDPKIAFANNAFAELFGYDEAALVGGSLRMLEGAKTEQLKLARLIAATDAAAPAAETTYLYTHAGAALLVELCARVIDPSHRVLTVSDITGQHEMQENNRLARVVGEQSRRTRSLYLISAASQTSGEQQIDAALTLVNDLMEMDYAYAGRIVDDSIVLESVVGTGVARVGDVVPLSETVVVETIKHGDVVAIEDIASPENRREGVREFPGFHSYISAPLVINSTAYGAIGFSSRSIKHFEEHDYDFILLVAALVASTIERQLQKKRLDDLAFYDMLTGLPNRLRFMRELDAAIARAQRQGGSFALHFVDLDGFKRVNDLAGHTVGDEVLIEVAQRMRKTLRPYDVPARLGGDEFVVLVPAQGERTDAEAIGARLVEVLGAPYATSAGEMTIGASVGIASFPADAGDAALLLRRADQALYLAKNAGKKRVAFYTEPERG